MLAYWIRQSLRIRYSCVFVLNTKLNLVNRSPVFYKPRITSEFRWQCLGFNFHDRQIFIYSLRGFCMQAFKKLVSLINITLGVLFKCILDTHTHMYISFKRILLYNDKIYVNYLYMLMTLFFNIYSLVWPQVISLFSFNWK